MSAPPPAGQPNGAPKANGANPPPGMRPNRPKPKSSIFAPKRTVRPSRPVGGSKPPPPPKKKSLEERRMENGGWSEPAPPNSQDIPIYTTKKELMKHITHHMMKLNSTKVDANHDPTDQEEFTRPVTLHRRNPLMPPAARTTKVEEAEKPPVDSEEAERLEKLKAEREHQKALDRAKIAPTMKEKAKPKQKKKDEKIVQRSIRSEYQKEQQELKFQETWPWFLEDADGKNVWQSSYIKAHSQTHVAFKIDGSVFRMIPIEKWYKFDFKPAGYKTYTTEEAEALMGKKMDVGRWAMKSQGLAAEQAELEATRNLLGAGSRRMIKTESSTFRSANKADKMDHDELDASGDEFQDDDEAHTFERTQIDEDEKEAKERIRREQLGANNFGYGDELELEKELEKELKEEEQLKTWGKSTKKALVKRDRDHQYESSSDEDRNPWKESVRQHSPFRVSHANDRRVTRHLHPTRKKRKSRTRRKIRRRRNLATASLKRTRPSWALRALRLRRLSQRPIRRAKARSRASIVQVRPPSPSLAEASRRARRKCPRHRPSRAAEPARPWLLASVRLREPALAATGRRRRVRCRTVPAPRRRSSSRAGAEGARHLARELVAPTRPMPVRIFNPHAGPSLTSCRPESRLAPRI